MVTCQRPYCTAPVTAYIPLPEGGYRTRIFLCALHEFQARKDCYYVCPIDGVESEEGFYRAIRQKHARIRGTDKLKFVPYRH